MSIYKLEPSLHSKIWGGEYFKDKYENNLENIGEVWVISAHANGMTFTSENTSLSELWKNGNFDGNDSEFPLLIKYIDAKDNLSVQVHPSDEFALELENQPFGKTECWYIVDALPGAKIIYGTVNDNIDEVRNMIDNNDYSFLKSVEVKKGDFFYVPAGLIHAVGMGVQILEIQQSSDTTYRLYDYDRLENGMPRELHLEKSKKVISFNQEIPEVNFKQEPTYSSTIFVDNEFFRVEKIVLDGTIMIENTNFTCLVILDGSGSINEQNVGAYESYICDKNTNTLNVSGTMELFIVTEG